MPLKVEDVMVKGVLTIEAESAVNEAVTIMSTREIGCLIVIHNEVAVGIVTERDMLKRVLLAARDPENTKVSQVMSTPLICGEPRMSVQNAVTLMSEKKIKKLPILEKGCLIGLITLTDLVRSVAYLKHMISNVAHITD
jgi:signal-transduction protein with cAMP-binding, CBS, and nucleotidyltransferase domain